MNMLDVFPQALRETLEAINAPVSDIRCFVGRPCSVQTAAGEILADAVLQPEELHEMAQRLCDRRLRLSPETTGEGFITLRGGHRMGLCGRVTRDGERLTLREVGSVCIRIAHEITGSGARAAALSKDGKKLQGVLIAGHPGSGKTTMLRDAVRLLSNAGAAVGLCDERGEVAACVQGRPQLDVGRRTHVLDGCPKEEGLRWLLRAMCPDVLAMDELYDERECLAVREAAACGVPVIATAHAGDINDLLARKGMKMLLQKNVFAHVMLLQAPGKALELNACQIQEAACCGR